MALDPSMRASDADREAVVARLRDGHAEGRLTIEEFEERLEATYAARTLAELVPITHDLPAPTDALRAPAPRDEDSPLRAMWGPWLVAVLLCTAVWGITSLTSGGLQYFWPIWVAGPWGAVLLARTIAEARPGRRALPERPGRQDHERDHR